MDYIFNRLGVDQDPGGGTAYPFVPTGQADSRTNLFGDFYLAYRDDDCQFLRPFHLGWTSGIGTGPGLGSPPFTPTHARDLLVYDANNVVVFNSTLATEYGETTWDGQTAIQWFDPTNDRVCRLVFNQAGTSAFTTAFNVNRVLDAQTLHRLPDRLRHLIVNGHRLSGRIRLVRGYNAVLTPGDPTDVDGERRQTSLTIAAVAKAGAGLVPGCSDAPTPIFSINGQEASRGGSFMIAGQSCVRTGLAVEVDGDELRYHADSLTDEQAAHALTIADDCAQCRPCDDYVNTYLGLRHVWDVWRALANKTEAVRDQYAENRERWIEARDCRMSHPLKILTVAEWQCKAFVGGSWCNLSDGCATNVEVRFVFESFDADGDPSDAAVDAQLLLAFVQADGPEFPIVGDIVRAGGRTAFRFWVDSVGARGAVSIRLRFCVVCASGGSVRVTMSVHAADPTNSAGVVKPLIRQDVPPDVIDLWAALGLDGSIAVGAVASTIPLNPDSQPLVEACPVG